MSKDSVDEPVEETRIEDAAGESGGDERTLGNSEDSAAIASSLGVLSRVLPSEIIGQLEVNNEDLATRIVNRATADIDSQGTPFSTQAFDLLKLKIASYLRQLTDEAARIAVRQKSDSISASYVQRASEQLVSGGGSRLSRHVGTVGGILLGASLSNILAMTAASSFTSVSILVSSGLAILGSFGVALSIGRD